VTRNNFDGSRHLGENGIRKQFEAVRKAAQVPWFPLNGWPHTAITRFAEAGVPIATIMARAGHCSPEMTAHYTHISMQAERMAMQSMKSKAGCLGCSDRDEEGSQWILNLCGNNSPLGSAR